MKSWRGKRACFVASDTRLCEYDGVERGWGSTATPETFKAKQYFTTILISNTTITLFHFTSKNSQYLAKIFIIKRNNSQLDDLANVLLFKFICARITYVSLLPFFGIHLPRTTRQIFRDSGNNRSEEYFKQRLCLWNFDRERAYWHVWFAVKQLAMESETLGIVSNLYIWQKIRSICNMIQSIKTLESLDKPWFFILP